MCGILGFSFKQKSEIINKDHFLSLLKLINHRGPDNTGFYHNENFIFGMNRLSIIDEFNGNQPMSSSDGEYKIIFNGEIYNFKELKKNLEEQKFVFKTNSDTEVVLNLYIKYGYECLNKMNGMFALAIYKKSTNELFLARDRFGKKPLYYYGDEKRFIFSSELKPIIHSKVIDFKINRKAIYDMTSLWYVAEPKCIVNKVFQLKPGHYLKLSNNNIVINKWSDIKITQSNLNFKDSAEYLKYLIEDSVKIRLNSDVKVATMLSGGVDSGIISHFYNKNYQNGEAFNIDFKEKSYSEYTLSKLTADKLGIKLHKVDYIDDKIQIEKILNNIDEPLGNASLVASYQIFKFINSKNIKVVLTGDGGDELFGGYPTYQSEYYHKFFKKIPYPIFNTLRKIIKFLPVSKKRISFDYKVKKLLKYIKMNPLKSHPLWREPLNFLENQDIFNDNNFGDKNYDPYDIYTKSYEEKNDLDNKNKLMLADFQNYLLNDHLRKLDRSSMLNSVEARCPFLDHRIVNFAFSLNSSFKVSFFELKKILKFIGKDFLDKKIISSPKLGLTPPINYWIDDYFKDYVYDITNSKSGLIFDIFNKSKMLKIYDDHFTKKSDYSRFIWSIISLNYWYESNKKYLTLK